MNSGIKKRSVIVLSSHVARGSIGTRAAVFALETLRHPVWAVPTILLPWHPGHGLSTKIVPPQDAFEKYLDDLANSPWLDECAAVLTGYMASSEQAASVANFISLVKAKLPDMTYLCDPVMGDGERLYIDEETAAIIRDRLVQLADIITPNMFELGWLTHSKPKTAIEAMASAKFFSKKTVLITSVPGMMRNQIGNLLLDQDEVLFAEHREIDGPPNGAGDLAAAIFLSNILNNSSMETILQRTTASVFEIIARSAKQGANELTLESETQSIIRPITMMQIRSLAVNTAMQISKPPG